MNMQATLFTALVIIMANTALGYNFTFNNRMDESIKVDVRDQQGFWKSATIQAGKTHTFFFTHPKDCLVAISMLDKIWMHYVCEDAAFAIELKEDGELFFRRIKYK